jgi:hypothetical protein
MSDGNAAILKIHKHIIMLIMWQSICNIIDVVCSTKSS